MSFFCFPELTAQVWKRATTCKVWQWQKTTTLDLHCKRGTLLLVSISEISYCLCGHHFCVSWSPGDWGFYEFDKSVFFLLHYLLGHGPCNHSKDGKQKKYGVDSYAFIWTWCCPFVAVKFSHVSNEKIWPQTAHLEGWDMLYNINFMLHTTFVT